MELAEKDIKTVTSTVHPLKDVKESMNMMREIENI